MNQLTSLALALSLVAAPALATPPESPYHVMWNTAQGKAKCCNKKSQEKADACAAKMRKKGKATKVEVMAGSCDTMKAK